MRRAHSKNSNILLQKDDVGKPKPNTRRLPNSDWTYGKPEIRDLEGAPEGEYF